MISTNLLRSPVRLQNKYNNKIYLLIPHNGVGYMSHIYVYIVVYLYKHKIIREPARSHISVRKICNASKPYPITSSIRTISNTFTGTMYS